MADDSPSGTKEADSSPSGSSAAQNDGIRIENIDHRRHGAAKALKKTLHRSFRQSIALRCQHRNISSNQ